MSPIDRHDAADRLERATRALRDVPIPQERLAENLNRLAPLLRRTEAELGPAINTTQRILPMKTLGIAATVLIVLGVGAFTLHLGSSHSGQSGQAFAQVVQPLLDAVSARFTLTTQSPGMPTEKTQGLFMAPGHTRLTLPDGKVVVVDANAGKMLVTDPAAQQARLVTWSKCCNKEQVQARPSVFFAMRDFLRRALDESDAVESLGRQNIAGANADAYQVAGPDCSVKVWADPATKMPLRVEMVRAGETTTLSDIAYNVAVDAAEFALTEPAGYKLTEEAPPLGLTITGTVKDVSGAPIAGARVEDDKYGPQPYRGANTDASGAYSFSTWPEEHRIVIKADGYKAVRHTISPRGDQKQLTLNFTLERE